MTACVTGEYRVGDMCFACSAGFYWQNKACKHCPPGKYQMHTNTTSCDACSAGKYHDLSYSSTTDQSCVACPSGKSSVPSQTRCKDKIAKVLPFLQSLTVNTSNVHLGLGMMSNSTVHQASKSQLIDVMILLAKWATATLQQVCASCLAL